MSLPKRYNPRTREPQIAAWWEEQGIYHFTPEKDDRPVFSIDTPPPSVSGNLHLGHAYSYTQTDLTARFRRMIGEQVFYPMGFDDNGLPTERLVEKREGIRAQEIGREAFIARCLAVSEQAEADYETLWRRLGLSIDWRYTYRTIDERSRRLAQWAFLQLFHKGLAYRQQAPTIWCPECQTAIAQAEVDDLPRESTFYTLAFALDDGENLPIATTRPELLPACVAIFIHPDDARATDLAGRSATVPLFGQSVPILADPGADPEKGTGIVMCCTFGDAADVDWWRRHQLPLIEAIGPDGRLRDPAGTYAGLSIKAARVAIVRDLQAQDLLLDRQPIAQTVRVHERCDTPVETIVTEQWFIRLLDFKAEFLAAGEQIEWYPAHMKTRYRQWVENLAWDWCISRQRYFGVPFPLWHCTDCGEVLPAEEGNLPLDPTITAPGRACPHCGGREFNPETDVMDTWATSSLTPQIVGRFFTDQDLYTATYPFGMRPQAHEIIRTWAFYTIVQSHFHFDRIPWKQAAISGWGLAPAGAGKLSKSRGSTIKPPLEMIDQYSADAVRYWTASTGLGKDAVIDEQKIAAGQKLVHKLWNVARFAGRFLEGTRTNLEDREVLASLSLGDRWLLDRMQQLIPRMTGLMLDYDFATAKSELEAFFWRDLADNYLEMAKKRLYEGGPAGAGARFTLHYALLTTIKLFAPFLPFVTEAIYQGLFDPATSIHTQEWPQVEEHLRAPDGQVAPAGSALLEIATVVRRYKSEANLSLGAELQQLQVIAPAGMVAALQAGVADLESITRAREITITSGGKADGRPEIIHTTDTLQVAIVP